MPRGMMLAAGRGTRLGPLTDTLPKPLLPVANTPVMAHGIACLRRLGIREICANVCYRGEQIIARFDDDHLCDLRLNWLYEQEASGTAGGMKGMQRFLDGDRVVVIAGDALLDLDLAPVYAAHCANGAFITLATVTVRDPSCYGVVVTDIAGRILRFQEKPAPGTEISRQANTGIYICEPEVFRMIPQGAFCDFAMDIFPEVLRQGLPFYAVPVEGYWTDIGNPGDYLQANLDFLAGRIRIEGCGTRIDDSYIGDEVMVAGSRLTRCVVGAGAVLPAGCELTDCVVWPGVELPEPVVLSSAVITPHGSYRVEGRTAIPVEEYDLQVASNR
ncbi:MAG: sugar phosphate nucleotidyltransferase [Armatimonadota bacterium]